jgi:hypothetical protein
MTAWPVKPSQVEVGFYYEKKNVRGWLRHVCLMDGRVSNAARRLPSQREIRQRKREIELLAIKRGSHG